MSSTTQLDCDIYGLGMSDTACVVCPACLAGYETRAATKARAEERASIDTLTAQLEAALGECVRVVKVPIYGDAVPFLQPCAGHSVYGDWRVSEARKAWEAEQDQPAPADDGHQEPALIPDVDVHVAVGPEAVDEVIAWALAKGSA